ncbi:hypothetical protein [Sulfurovum sp.]|uniref:hypothetical protein n=1 Tax=Sulfurovum sp. TaxID=1969726 RepID=UPI003561A7AB
MPSTEITRFSTSFALSINKLYKSGGFALAFGFAGIVMIMGAKLVGDTYASWIIGIGASITFLCLIFFLYTATSSHNKAKRAISDNQEAIDAVQDISIELTMLAQTAQAYAFKNLESINGALQVTIPKIKAIPLIGEKITELGLDKIESLSGNIVENTTRMEKVVKEIREALITADHLKLNEYSQELSNIIINLKKYLKQ